MNIDIHLIQGKRQCMLPYWFTFNKVVSSFFSFLFFIGAGFGQELAKVQDKDADEPVGIPPLPAVQKKPGIQVRSTTSGSSGEQSDDDEAEGETTQSTDPTDVKRVRR